LEFNWSTFILEIFNFLVLVWILKRFLYQPVLDVIARRRIAIENQLAESEQHHAEANALKEQYENRLANWELEREKASDNLQHELEQHRLDQLDTQKTELAQAEEKNRISRAKQDEQMIREIERRALLQGAKFASQLLSQAAGPELQNRLLEILLLDLKAISTEQIQNLSNDWEESPEQIQITSAYPLTDEQRQQLQETLLKVTGLSAPVNYAENTELRAGLIITIGAWVLQLNVRDELQGFTEFIHVER